MGIDTGKRGGVTVINSAGDIVFQSTWPLVGKELEPRPLWDLFKTIHNMYGNYVEVVIEKVWGRPGSAANATFKFGECYGYLRMLVAACGWKHTLVPSTTWTKTMCEGVDTKLDTKQRSLIAATRLWPDEKFLATERSKKPHDGLYESALLAAYCKKITSK